MFGPPSSTGNQRWKGLTWGMLPLLGGAMSACTYHFFYNPAELDILVALQVCTYGARSTVPAQTRNRRGVP